MHTLLLFLGFLGTKVRPNFLLPHGAVFDSCGKQLGEQFSLIFHEEHDIALLSKRAEQKKERYLLWGEAPASNLGGSTLVYFRLFFALKDAFCSYLNYTPNTDCYISLESSGSYLSNTTRITFIGPL